MISCARSLIIKRRWFTNFVCDGFESVHCVGVDPSKVVEIHDHLDDHVFFGFGEFKVSHILIIHDSDPFRENSGQFAK